MTGGAREPRTLDVRAIQLAYGDDEPVGERVQRAADIVRAQRGADLIVMPELWAPGYFTFESWADRAETLEGGTVAALAAAAAEVGAVVHLGSLLERTGGRAVNTASPSGGRGMWNTSVMLGRDGSRLASYRKIHPFGFGEGEPALIDPGDRVAVAAIDSGPAHPKTIVGMATCYDLRFPELFRELNDAGATIFAIPAAWPEARIEHWEVLGRARAIENQAFVVQCNTGGAHGGVVLGGCSQIVSPGGEVLARAGSGEEVIEAQLNLTELEEYRRDFPVLADRRLPQGEGVPS